MGKNKLRKIKAMKTLKASQRSAQWHTGGPTSHEASKILLSLAGKSPQKDHLPAKSISKTPSSKHNRTMAGPLLTKRKTKKSQKRLGRPPRDHKLKGLISLFNRLLQKKQKCKKNLIFDFEDNSLVKPVNDAEVFEKFHRLADELLCDDDDLLENCHRLAERFETLKINKRVNNVDQSEKFHHSAAKIFSDGEDLLKNSHRFMETFATPKVNKASQPNAGEDNICISIKVDEDDKGEFFKACQRSAKKIAVPKILKDSRSTENKFETNSWKKIISIDLIENVYIPKSMEDYLEKIKIVKKQLEENKKVPENLRIVPKPEQEKKEMPDIVSNPTEKLIAPKPLEKNKETIQVSSKQLEKNTEKTDVVTKQLEKKTEQNKTVVKSVDKTVPKPPEKLINPLEKKPEKQGEEKSKIATQGIKDFRFSTAEKKKVGKYNNNLYNPGKSMCHPKPNRRNIILDGSNVAFAHGRTCFSSKGLLYCLQYFQKMGHDVKAVVPLFRRNAFQSTDHKILDELHRNGKIVFTPCKNFLGQRLVSYDDRFILQLAYEWNAVVVSNDNYRDLIDESPAIRMIVETRVLGYTWFNDIFILPKDPYGREGPTLDEILTSYNHY